MPAAPLEERCRDAQRTQSFFREINDRVAELSEDWDASPVRFVCECLRVDCGATIPLSLDEYRQVRSDPTRFIVVAGHEDKEIEDVLERHGGCLVVRQSSVENGR